MSLKKPLLVGTQHKAGTVYMLRVFEAVSKEFGLTLVHDEGLGCHPKDGVDIFFSDKCRFHNDFLALEAGFLGLRIIRDPRDIMISGAHYHLKAAEEWLDQPMGDGGPLSYRQLLKDMPSWRTRFETELVYLTRIATSFMADQVQHPHAMRQDTLSTLRLEHLMAGEGLYIFNDCLKGLDLPPEVSREILKQAEKFSFENSQRDGDHHLTTSDKGPRWPKHLDRALATHVDYHLGEALVTLEYEQDRLWFYDLPAHNPALDEAINQDF